MSTQTKILIIEDETALSEVLSAKIKKEGYEVTVAVDGEDGFKKIKDWHPDLILLDIVMPKMNGYEVLEKINEEKINIPVIIISNSGQPVELEKIKTLGAVDYLIKTKFDPDQVIAKIKKYLAGQSGEVGAEAEVKTSGSQKGPKVLLVEDDSFLREICTRKLNKEGFAVFEAADGGQALKDLEKIEPDIILLDIILPLMDGFDVLEKIRSNKNEKIRKTPVLILSNLGQEDDAKKALALGANDYLVKAHFTTEEIVEKVRKELAK